MKQHRCIQYPASFNSNASSASAVAINPINHNSHNRARPAFFWRCLSFIWVIALVFSALPRPHIALAASAAVIRRVAASGIDSGDCTSVACQTIQYAISQSFPGEQIQIAAGIYMSSGPQVVYIPHTLTLSGGFDETFTAQTGTTIIDGEQSRRGIYVPSNISALFDHLTIQNGRTNGQGAGIYAGPDSPLTLQNVIVQQNFADVSGGGVYGEAEVNARDSRFFDNRSAGGVGGGLYGNTTTTLQNTDFISNTAPYGGGAYSHGIANVQGGRFAQNVADGGAGMLVSSTLYLADSFFVGNIASGFGGGGIYIDGTAVITNPQFIDNQTGAGAGGGIYVRNAITLTGAQFRGNTASYGGGIYARQNAQVIGGVFLTNTSTAGGALFAAQSVILTAVNFTNNTSTISGGGAVYAQEDIWVSQSQFEGNRTVASGGGIYAGQMITVSNTTFHQNVANFGGGVFANQDALLAQVSFDANTSNSGAGLYGVGPITAMAVSVANNIASGNGGGLYAANLVQVDKSLVQNNRCTDPGCLGGGFYLGSGGQVWQTRFIKNIAPKGGAIFLLNGDAAINNSLFASNFATSLSGSALYLNSPGTTGLLHSTVVSPTFSPGTAIYIGHGTANISNTIVASQSLAVHANGGLAYEDGNMYYGVPSRSAGTVVLGSASFEGHPAFVNPSLDDYHLQFSSMAINRGLVTLLTTDIDDDSRPQNGGPDIGMDETGFATANDLVISQSAPVSAVLPGQIITYTLRFTNLAQLATNAVLTDLFPSTVQVLSVSPSVAIVATPGQTHVWALPELALGEGGTIIVRVKVDPSISNPITITQTAVIGSPLDNNVANNSSTVTVAVWMPITGLNTSSHTVALGEPTPFTADVSSGNNISYTWAFGDGATGTGVSTAHVYGAVGAYAVVVTATNGLSTVTQTMQVQVNDVAVTGLNMTSTVTSTVSIGTPVTFGGQVSTGSNVTYTWRVDGVVVGIGPTLPYVFSQPGPHTVTVTASNGAGTQTSSLNITVVTTNPLNRKLYLPLMKVVSGP